MYYVLILISVAMFGGCFALNDSYRKLRGSGMKISLQFSFFSSLAGLLVLMVLGQMEWKCTPFALIIGLLTAINGFAFTFCGFKALGTINLSLYSLFSMLGGMALPSLQGILFYGEKITWAKVVCFAFVLASLLMTVEKSERKKGTIYYIGIFVLNGMAGVLSKIFTSAPASMQVSAADFSAVSATGSVVISALLLLLFYRKKGDTPPQTLKTLAISAGSGIANRIANFLLVIALMQVDASVQYPMVTGGVIIVSTLISSFGPVKPTKKELISVALAFIGLLALFLIKI